MGSTAGSSDSEVFMAELAMWIAMVLSILSCFWYGDQVCLERVAPMVCANGGLFIRHRKPQYTLPKSWTRNLCVARAAIPDQVRRLTYSVGIIRVQSQFRKKQCGWE
eukprot:9475800-Pyramimonas_sp.AAC.1